MAGNGWVEDQVAAGRLVVPLNAVNAVAHPPASPLLDGQHRGIDVATTWVRFASPGIAGSELSALVVACYS